MEYADAKLIEEERRAKKYLDINVSESQKKVFLIIAATTY